MTDDASGGPEVILKPDALLAHLRVRGILVRDCRNFEGVPPRFFRFCIRTSEENSRLIEVLNDFAEVSKQVKADALEAVS